MKEFSSLTTSFKANCTSFGTICNPASSGCCKTLICSLNATAADYFCTCDAGFFFDKPSEECLSIAEEWIAYSIALFGMLAIGFSIITFASSWWKKRLKRNTQNSGEFPGTHRQLSSSNNSDLPEPVEPSGPNHRSELYMILMHGLSVADGHPPQYQTVIEACDFPPAYPGPPLEDHPPTYEEAFNHHHSIR